jgi:hypothetical protein
MSRRVRDYTVLYKCLFCLRGMLLWIRVVLLLIELELSQLILQPVVGLA